ncbi:phosphopantetheine-binding protein, partial [Kitasatospora sp. NPDC058263]
YGVSRRKYAPQVWQQSSGVLPQSAGSRSFADPAQELIAAAWREVLGHDRFSADSHFFEVGGHSLLAAQLAAHLEPHLGSRPPLRTLFRHAVLADQARALIGQK